MLCNEDCLYIIEVLSANEWIAAEARPMFSITGACKMIDHLPHGKYRVAEYQRTGVCYEDETLTGGLSDPPSSYVHMISEKVKLPEETNRKGHFHARIK